MANKVIVPDIGDFENVEIIEILVKSGDKIKKNDSIVTLESDKSSVEVPSTLEGTIENINVKIGDKVSKGDVLLSVSNEQSDFKDKEVKERASIGMKFIKVEHNWREITKACEEYYKYIIKKNIIK